MQPLERRFILGAPVALDSDGLVLASPTASEDLLDAEPAPVPAPAEATAPPPPALAPEADPLSPAGDPKKAKPGGGTTLLSTSSGGSYYVDVWMEPVLGDVTNVLEFGETSGQFRFHATACGTSGLPYGVTITYERGGDASPTTDLSGAFSAGTTIYVPLDGSETNKSGTAVLGFNARDDEVDEPGSPESFWARITSALDGNGQAANILPMNQQTGTVASNEYTVSAGGLDPTTVTGGGGAVHRYLKFHKEGQGLNGHAFTVVSVLDHQDQPSNAVTVSPAVGGSGTTANARVSRNPDVYEDGVADITVAASPNANAGDEAWVTVRFAKPADSSKQASYFEVTFRGQVQ